MNEDYTTIYGRYRRAAGITQERAAELLGVAPRTLANWEAGVSVPPDLRVLDMCDIYGANTLAIEHLRGTTVIARDVLPAVASVPLAQAVAQLLWRINEFEEKHRAEDLLWISSNGMVGPGEQEERFAEIVEELRAIVQAALALQYAGGGI